VAAGGRSAAPQADQARGVLGEEGDYVLGEGGTNLAYATTLPAGHRGKLRCADIFFMRAGLDHGFLYRAGSLIKVNRLIFNVKRPSGQLVLDGNPSKPLRQQDFPVGSASSRGKSRA
jgi:hypothetical protein